MTRQPHDSQTDTDLKRAAQRSNDLLNARMAQRRRDPGQGEDQLQEPSRTQKRDGGEEGRSHRRRQSAHGQSGHTRGAGRSGRAGASHARPETIEAFIRRNNVFIMGVSGVVIIVVILLFALRFASADRTPDDVDGEAGSGQPAKTTASAGASSSTPSAPSNPSYDWNEIDTTDGRYSLVSDGRVISSLGVDVSSHQGAIDWQAVADDGIDFAIIRLGYRGATAGLLNVDEHFEDNMEGAKEAGLKRGVYFFSQAVSTEEAVAEADFVLEHLGDEALDYPVVYDCETEIDGIEATRVAALTEDEATAIAKAFFERIESAGYKTMLYGSWRDLARYNPEFVEEQAIWWAEYDTDHPSADIDIALWQYTHDGAVAGLTYGADMNVAAPDAAA